ERPPPQPRGARPHARGADPGQPLDLPRLGHDPPALRRRPRAALAGGARPHRRRRPRVRVHRVIRPAISGGIRTMSTHSRLRTSLLVAAAATVACGIEPPIGEVEQDLGSTYKASIKRGTLTITGNDASSKLALRLGANGRLEVDVGDDGTADFSFDRSKFSSIVIDAGGGDDIVRMDESNGAFTTDEQITIIGGPGDDTLIGGIGAETFYGGPGNDTIIGGGGNDVIFGGDGDDTIVWNPGNGSDVIEGEGGNDTLVFNGAAIAERLELSTDAGRLRFTRDIGNIVLDLN